MSKTTREKAERIWFTTCYCLLGLAGGILTGIYAFNFVPNSEDSESMTFFSSGNSTQDALQIANDASDLITNTAMLALGTLSALWFSGNTAEEEHSSKASNDQRRSKHQPT